MAEMYFKKQGQILIPEFISQDDFAALPNNTVFKVVISQPRNYLFHKKFFSMVKCAYDLWQPNGAEGVAKSFENFREELIVLCGYYETVFSIHGNNFKLIPKSISFAKMNEETFKNLYSTAIDIILKNVLKNYKKSDLEDVILRVVGYS
jgi:hypothetical protein